MWLWTINMNLIDTPLELLYNQNIAKMSAYYPVTKTETEMNTLSSVNKKSDVLFDLHKYSP